MQSCVVLHRVAHSFLVFPAAYHLVKEPGAQLPSPSLAKLAASTKHHQQGPAALGSGRNGFEA